MFGWFRRKEPMPDVEARLSALEKRVDEIDVQWSEWYDKYRRLYARLAKRVHDDAAREEAAPTPQNGASRLGNMGRPMNPLAAQLLRGPHSPEG